MPTELQKPADGLYRAGFRTRHDIIRLTVELPAALYTRHRGGRNKNEKK